MHIDSALFDIDIAAPDGIEQLFAAEHPAGVFEEMAQQAELGRAKLHRTALARHLVGRGIHDDAGKFEVAALQRRAQAAQHGADAGDSSRGENGLVT